MKAVTPPAAPEVTPDVRAALLRKYRLLTRWRRSKDAAGQAAEPSGDVAAPAAMRALAEEFPGALRELDLLGLPELERRAAYLAAEPTPEPEPWLAWIHAYHALMRLALALRSATPPAALPPIEDERFLHDARRPPGGRLSTAVLQALARRFERPAEEIRAVLFPPRRPHREPEQ
jgi:hypothetical protein